jgi:hypothetical protein
MLCFSGGIPVGCQLLVTTRSTDVVVGLGGTEFQVDLLTPEESLRLLSDWSGLTLEALPPEAPAIVRECGQLPLAIAAIRAMVRLSPGAWRDALMRLQRADLGKVKKSFPDYPYPHLLRALEVSVEALPQKDRERYLDLSIFPENASIPEGPLRLLWELDDLDTRDAMRRLHVRSLATLKATPAEGLSLSLHDLHRDLVQKLKAGELSRLHARLVAAYSAVCKARSLKTESRSGTEWATGPDDGYFFQNLRYHLGMAGRTDESERLLADGEWAAAKLRVTNERSIIADYEHILDKPDLERVEGGRIQLSAFKSRRRLRKGPAQFIGVLGWFSEVSARALAKLAEKRLYEDEPSVHAGTEKAPQ